MKKILLAALILGFAGAAQAQEPMAKESDASFNRQVAKAKHPKRKLSRKQEVELLLLLPMLHADRVRIDQIAIDEPDRAIEAHEESAALLKQEHILIDVECEYRPSVKLMMTDGVVRSCGEKQ